MKDEIRRDSAAAPEPAAASENGERAARLQTELDAVYASASWRVTAPLRAISQALRGRRRSPGHASDAAVGTEMGARVLIAEDASASSPWRPDPATIAINPRVPLEGCDRPLDLRSLDLHWILPDAATGSGGGHMTIFRHVRFLEQQGHRQTLWLRPPWFHETPEDARLTIETFYQPIGERVQVAFLPDEVGSLSGDAVIATDFWTAYPVLAMGRFRERFYLVQDYEADFHPRGAAYQLARNSYTFGLKTLCAGPWLFNKMKTEFGCWAHQWDLAYDREHYFPHTERAPGGPATGSGTTPSIAFYHRPSTPRRAVELAVAALRLLHGRAVSFHVHFFGEPLSETPAYPHTDHGTLDAAGLGALYRACDLGMVFSATNYSLIPLEMMACGLPVLELDSDCARSVFAEGTLFLAQPDPTAIAQALEAALASAERRRQVAEQALSFIAGLEWERSSRTLEQGLLEGLRTATHADASG
jgi:glycosyltransferase involved in cell wall biosynthesis